MPQMAPSSWILVITLSLLLFLFIKSNLPKKKAFLNK